MRPYIPPPTRCLKCQRFGHIAVACRATNRCAKGGGDHEYGNCGEHSAAYKGCIAHKRAIKVQIVKVKGNITYAEAIRKVDYNRPTKSSASPKVSQVVQAPSQRVVQKCCKVSEKTLVGDKEKSVAFMVEVINCTAQTDSKTVRIKIIIKAGEKYLEGRRNDS